MLEKRQHERFDVENMAGAILMISEVSILDLSLGGVSIETNKKLEMGREYTLVIEQPDKTISVTGRVVWSLLKTFITAEDGSSLPVYQAGLRFKDILTDEAFAILPFISANKDEIEKRLRGLRFTINSDNPTFLKSTFKYKVKQISLGGMRVQVNHELKRDDSYPMEISLGQELFKITGRITSCRKQGPKRYDVGLAFSELTDEDQAKLADFISSM
ncbi:PilZ domain-containing protein [candidate division CSSED10-310 bacterium]|uniref:PilZ domain-containing protein n=1 Tax=candidate division CSSED10-310 bacterium TaxID=2855610 RepID=A0ABV6YVS1_UNCC1